LLPPALGRRGQRDAAQGGKIMLWTIFVVLLVAWLLGLVSSYTLGGYIHLLLLVALVVLVVNVIQGRRTVV
jgi:hypothetical protein